MGVLFVRNCCPRKGISFSTTLCGHTIRGNSKKQVIHCNILIDKSSLPHSELCPGTCDINSIIPKELFKFIAVMNF